MLLQFIVENFRSFRTEEVLNMAPAKSRIHRGHVVRAAAPGRRVSALPIAVLYGANGSGKSNLIAAISFARDLVLQGTRGEAPVATIPFQLCPEGASAPSRFEFILKHDGVQYSYGFTTTRSEVREEWLFAVFEKQEVKLFERRTEEGKARMEFGVRLAPTKDDRQRLNFVAAGTRPNQLFLTEANERNVDLLKPLMHWFRDHLTVILPNTTYQPLALRAHDDKVFAQFLTDFLQVADTGVRGIDVFTEALDAERHFRSFPQQLSEKILEHLGRRTGQAIIVSGNKQYVVFRQDKDGAAQRVTLRTEHQRSDGGTVFFDVEDESDGTNRLMHLAPALLDLQSNEDVYLIDELDRSLHPHLTRLFVESFLKGVVEQKSRGQVILTTHDTGLLDLALLRRDEIWFVEKDQEGASHLSSLAQFNFPVRADLKVAKGYLAGRFGAVPFVGDVRALTKPPMSGA